MNSGHGGLVLVFAWLLAAATLAAQQPPADQEHAALQQLVAGLGQDTFEARQAAMKQIWNSPHLTLESLQRFTQTTDPETAARIQRLVDQIEMGITPHTPPDVARRIYAFHAADQDEMFSILYDLVQLGQHELVMNLITSLQDDYVREYLASSVFDEDHSPIFALLPATAGELDATRLARLDGLMDHSFMWHWHTSDCLVYWSIRERIPQQIEALRQEIQSDGPSDELQIRLIECLRFDKQYDRALAQIEQLPGSQARRNALRQRVLREAGRWQALANEYELGRVNDARGQWSRAGEAALTHYWSGNPERQIAWQSTITRSDTPESCNALATIQLAEMDLPGLRETCGKMTPGAAFELLCRMEQYEEAFRISGAPQDPEGRQTWFRGQLRILDRKLNLSRTRDDEQAQREAVDLLLLLPAFAKCVGDLGDIEQAKWYFEQLAERLRGEVSYQSLFWRTQTFEQVSGLNIGDEIWHYFELLALHEEVERVVETLFPDTPDEAAMWSEILRQSVPEPVERMRFVASLLKSPHGDAGQQFDIELLTSVARQYIDRRPAAQRANYLFLLGRTCQLHERQALARDLTLEAGFLGEPQAFAALADEAAAAQQWDQALAWAERLQEISPPGKHRYRAACYKKMLGDEEAFASECRHAGLLDLHSWNVLDTAQMLQASGFPEVSLEISSRFLSAITAEQSDVYWVHQRLATLHQDSDPGQALWHWRQAQLSWTGHMDLSINNTYRTQYYATEAAMAEAQVALNEGHASRAAEILLRCATVSSASTSLVERFVPQLDQADETRLADRVFTAVIDRFQTVLARWPDSALHHNNLAWACARCHRRPDLQLAHARRAVELEPDNTSYLDTLGEVLYLGGETDEAITLARRCIQLNPFSQHYREQLQRYQGPRD